VDVMGFAHDEVEFRDEAGESLSRLYCRTAADGAVPSRMPRRSCVDEGVEYIRRVDAAVRCERVSRVRMWEQSVAD